jgi:hypothetical protein
MEARLAAITASLNESRALLASCTRRLGVKEQAWQEATMTTSLFAPYLVHEQPETKPSVPTLVSTHRVVAAAALDAGAVVIPTVPISCSTLGFDVNVGNNLVVPRSQPVARHISLLRP